MTGMSNSYCFESEWVTHPLPRGGTDLVQVRLLTFEAKPIRSQEQARARKTGDSVKFTGCRPLSRAPPSFVLLDPWSCSPGFMLTPAIAGYVTSASYATASHSHTIWARS